MDAKVKAKGQAQDAAGITPGEASTGRARRKGRTNSSRISSKHQVTIPVDVMREAGFKVGDELVFKVEDGGVMIERKFEGHRILSLSGILNGIYNGYDHEAEMADAWED